MALLGPGYVDRILASTADASSGPPPVVSLTPRTPAITGGARNLSTPRHARENTGVSPVSGPASPFPSAHISTIPPAPPNPHPCPASPTSGPASPLLSAPGAQTPGGVSPPEAAPPLEPGKPGGAAPPLPRDKKESVDRQDSLQAAGATRPPVVAGKIVQVMGTHNLMNEDEYRRTYSTKTKTGGARGGGPGVGARPVAEGAGGGGLRQGSMGAHNLMDEDEGLREGAEGRGGVGVVVEGQEVVEAASCVPTGSFLSPLLHPAAALLAGWYSLHPTPAFLENATVRGRAWNKRLDAPVLTLDVTVSQRKHSPGRAEHRNVQRFEAGSYWRLINFCTTHL